MSVLHLTNSMTFVPSGEVKTLMIQLLRGVRHLHDNWILHRDLKTSNLLLSHKGILKVRLNCGSPSGPSNWRGYGTWLLPQGAQQVQSCIPPKLNNYNNVCVENDVGLAFTFFWIYLDISGRRLYGSWGRVAQLDTHMCSFWLKFCNSVILWKVSTRKWVFVIEMRVIYVWESSWISPNSCSAWACSVQQCPIHLKHKSEPYVLPVVWKVKQIDIGSYNVG